MMSSLAFSGALLVGAGAIVTMSVWLSVIGRQCRRQDQATTLAGVVIGVLLIDWLAHGEWHTVDLGRNMLHLSALLVFEYMCFCNVIRRFHSMSTVTKPPIRPRPKPLPGQE